MDNYFKIVIIYNFHHNHIRVADKIKPHINEVTTSACAVSYGDSRPYMSGKCCEPSLFEEVRISEERAQ